MSDAIALAEVPNDRRLASGCTPRMYLATLDALTGVRYQRLRLGRWVAAEGLVYDGWDRAVHVVDSFVIPSDWSRFLSIDFGYTNPFAAQWWALDHDGRLYLYREIYYTQRLVEDHARQIVELSQGERIRAVICDWDAEGRATLERHALPRLGLRQTTQAFKVITAGIQAVAARLRPAGDGKPRLVLLRDALVERDPLLDDKKLPACTAEEMDAYVWDVTNGRKKGEVPVDRDNHGEDATRYMTAALDLVARPPKVVHATFGAGPTVRARSPLGRRG